MDRILRKLRNLSLPEIRERSSQFANRTAERLGVSPLVRIPSDEELGQKFGEGRVLCHEGLLNHFRNTDRGIAFYKPLLAPQSIASEMRSRAEDADAVIAIANSICEGKFNLLGFGELNFGHAHPDWHLDPLSGKRSPTPHWSRIDELSAESTGDKKVIWELNRHQYFTKLGQAYWLTGDEKYSKTFADHIESWMESNPPKIGINWLSSLEVAFRSVSWIWAYYFFRNSPNYTPGLFARMLKFLYLNGLHIESYLSTYFSPNTHLTGEALGLYFIGLFLHELKEAKRWKQTGYKVLLDSLDFQVRPDGTYCEQAAHYLRYTIDFYSNLLILRRLEGVKNEQKIEAKLNDLFDCMLQVSYPDGRSPNFGDDDGGRLYFLDNRPVWDLRPAFALGAVLLERPDLKLMAGGATTELLWLLGPEGLHKFNEMRYAEPTERVKSFDEGGLFAARSDWSCKADSILIDCGPHGFLNGGHAHADALSFVLALDGEPVFMDSGTYNYTLEPEERNKFRSSAAHNCLTVNNESSSIPAGTFSWKSMASSRLLEWLPVDDGIQFSGTHNGYERLGVCYERKIEFRFDGTLNVDDIVTSATTNTYQVNFILSPELTADIIDERSHVEVKNREGASVLTIKTDISSLSGVASKWCKETWYVSPLYGAKRGSERLVLIVEGEGRIIIQNRMVKRHE